MTPDDTTLIDRPAQSAAEQRLLRLIAEMLRELRPGAPPRATRLDDSIERDGVAHSTRDPVSAKLR